ncbi:LAME_0A03642g1_1 [Lachancea meyersii CBS 8951]|uniref:LAME_0A03642g1_1 n=1 Tax=Lachancea meyersii CBS 8951 TaxID=1266667 RepID=A0A1G4INI9_9SACH|nr:LAME_0A03642g1_1 [Lachancea meyersii CBS 8951]
MNLLVSLTNGITKHGIKEPLVIAEKGIYSPRTLKNDKVLNAQTTAASICNPKKSKSQGSLEKLRMVGKGSMFERRAAQEYLSPYAAHQFARHTLSPSYDASHAQANYLALKRLKTANNSDTMLFNMSKQYVEEMIPLLVFLTPPEVSTGHAKRPFRNEVFTEIPSIPDFTKQPKLFSTYIGTLTHTRFLYKKSSSLNGVIPKILRNLMHPSNLKTIQLRDVEVFNDVIFFFSERSDQATCRELFSQMKLEGVMPNTKTFNLMLRNVLRKSHIRSMRHPLHDALYFLRQMRHHEVQADSVTWATCYNLLIEGLSRDVFLEKLIECSVPITPQLVLAVLTSGELSSSQLLRFLTNNSVPLDTKLFNLCLKTLLAEEKYDAAWAFVDHAHENARFKLNHESMNLFLRRFAELGRLDLALLTFNSAVKTYGIEANLQSFDMLGKALVRNGYTNNFSLILDYLCRSRDHHTKEVQVFSYWLSKARAMAKFNIRREVTNDGIERTRKLLAGARWTSQGLKWDCWNSDPSLRKVFRLLGCVPRAVKVEPKKERFTTGEGCSAKKKKFKNRVRTLAVRSAMLKRVPYAEDRYSALKEELQERNILE